MLSKSAIMIGHGVNCLNAFQILQKFASTPTTNQCGLIRDNVRFLDDRNFAQLSIYKLKKYDENLQ